MSMFAKIFPQHFPIRFGLVRGPALFKIIPAILCLLAAIDYSIAQKLPIGEYVKFLHLKNADARIIGGELIVSGLRSVMPLRLIILARRRG